MLCPNCGTENDSSAPSCRSCGHALQPEAAEPIAQLLLQSDGADPQIIPLVGSMTIGRIAGNDIVIPDAALSRQHARLEISGDGVSVVDLGSLNGVFVNDVRVEDVRQLRNGDVIRLGRTTLTARIPEPAVEEPEPNDVDGAAPDDEDLSPNEVSLPEPTVFMAEVPVFEEPSQPADAPEPTLFVADARPASSATLLVADVEAAAQADLEAADEEAVPIESREGEDNHQGSDALEAPSGEPASDEMTILSVLPRLEDVQVEEASEDVEPIPVGPVGFLILEEIRTPLYDVLTVGRAEGNDIRMDTDRLMSRNHARFEAREDGAWLVDLNSANGSFVNGTRVSEPALLFDGDEVRCGGAIFTYEVAVAPSLDESGAADYDDDLADDRTLQGTDADNYIREAEVAEFQAMRGGDTEPVARRDAEAVDQFRLVVNFGPEAGRSFTLAKDETVIGRAGADVEFDVQLNDRAVSRPHARITRDQGGFVIHDLGSANGTWLNYTDEISAPRHLVDGDIIKLGKTTLVYRVPATIRPPTPVQTLDPNLAQVMTFFSLKGGVGTTTLSVNLAVLLRELTGQPVLLIDLSTERGAVSVHLNLASKLTLADLPTDPGMIDSDVVESIIVTHPTGVDVLPSPPSPQSAELVTPASIASILPIVRGRYKWIIVDTSSTFSELNLGVFDQSDLIMLVCAPDLTSLKVTQATLDIFSALQIPAEKRVLVLSHIPPRSHLQQEDIERTLGERVGLTVPHAGEAVLDSIDRGVPVAVGDAGGPMVEAIRTFAAQLAQIKREAEVQPRRGGLGRWVQSLVSSLRR